MDLLHKDNKIVENTFELGKALIKLIDENLEMKRWKFELAYTNFAERNSQVVIYDSVWCRVCFIFSRQRLPQYDELSISYGRLHAPNEEPYLEWEGTKCRCWQDVWNSLRYLDGLSPSEAIQQSDVLNQLPIVAENFWNSSEGKGLREIYPPKYGIILQSVLWKHYGQSLFELFDLRKPDLWQSYQKFLREYYQLLGKKSYFGPPYENVC